MNQQVTLLDQQIQRVADTIGLAMTQMMLGDPAGPNVSLPPDGDQRPRGVGWRDVGANIAVMFQGVGQHLEQTILSGLNGLLAAATDWRQTGVVKLNEVTAQYNQLRTDCQANDWSTAGVDALNTVIAQYNQLLADIQTATIPTTAIAVSPLAVSVAWTAAAVLPYPVVTGIMVTPTTATIVVGGTVQGAAQISGGSGPPTWSVSDPTVATVDSSGLITGVARGQTTVYATFGGVTGAATVVVS